MPKVKKVSLEEPAKRKRSPATTPEARENQLIALAVDVVEQRLLNGTASSAEIVHFLKLGSTKNELEKEKLRSENELAKAKVDAIKSAQQIEELYANAIRAMKGYTGQEVETDESDEEY